MKNKILIVQTGSTTELILTTPLIKYTKTVFPEAEIDVVVRSNNEKVLNNNPNIETIIQFSANPKDFIDFINLVSKLRKGKYELALIADSSMMMISAILLSGIKERIGFNRWLAARYLTKKVPYNKKFHYTERMVHLIRFYFSNYEDLFPEIYINDEAEKSVKNILLENRVSSSETKIIGIVPGIVKPIKRWSVKNYISLVNKLNQDNYSVILLGSGEDVDLCKSISDNTSAVNLAGKFDFLELSAVVKTCDKLIGSDSFVMHIASAINTESISFLGPSIKDEGLYPIGETDKSLEVDIDCRPCEYNKFKSCPKGHTLCLREIKVEDVLKKISPLS